MLRHWAFCVVTVGSAATFTPAATATVLTFDAVTGGFPTLVPPGYGSRVVTSPQDGFVYDLTFGPTPNVVAAFDPNARFWAGGYGDLTNVLYGFFGSFSLTLTADPGYFVELHRFDMAGWPNTDYTITRVAVEDAVTSAVLFESLNVLIRGSSIDPMTGLRRTRFAFPSPITATSLRVLFQSDTQNVGIDNIGFGQFIPEPTGLGVLLPCGVLLKRRRK